MRWVNRPHVYHAGNKRSTTPPSLGFWFSRSKHSFPPRGRSENHCEGGGDFKQPEEGRGGETCSGGWGRRTLGLRRLVQERACEVKPWTHDEPSPVPSRSLPLTRTDASSHTRGATWGAEAHSWDIQGCGGSSVQHALGVWGLEHSTPQVPARGWCQVPGGPCFPKLMAGGPSQSDCRVAPVTDAVGKDQRRGQGPFGGNNVLMKTLCSSLTSWGGRKGPTSVASGKDIHLSTGTSPISADGDQLPSKSPKRNTQGWRPGSDHSFPPPPSQGPETSSQLTMGLTSGP